MLIIIFIAISLLTASNYSYGQSFTYRESNFDPKILKIKEEEYLGKEVPHISIKDVRGRSLSLEDFSGRPLLISLIYYRCPHVCMTLNEGLAEALNKVGLKIGEDFNVLTLSFNKEEDISDAKEFRERLKMRMSQYDKLPQGFEKWVFAIASAQDIKRLTKSVGFQFFYSEQDKIFVHPNVYIFLSPDRKIMRYIFGLYPNASDIQLAIIESARGKIGKSPLINTALLACYRYDSSVGGYTLNLPFVFGMVGIFMLTLTLTITFFYSRKIKKKKTYT
jgi:protein SCO1/2